MKHANALAAVATLTALLTTPAIATEAYTLSCPGTIVTNGTTGGADCTNGSGGVTAWQTIPPFDVSQLDYGEAGQAFAAGFVMVGMCWGLGVAVGAIMKVIKR